jgi:hypothetical protein
MGDGEVNMLKPHHVQFFHPLIEPGKGLSGLILIPFGGELDVAGESGGFRAKCSDFVCG